MVNPGVFIRNARMYVKSREIFRNWQTSVLDYFMAKAGLKKCVRVHCADGGKLCIPPILYRTTVLFYSLGSIKSVSCNKDTIYINGVGFSIRDKIIVHTKDGIAAFKEFRRTYFDIFIFNDYGIIDVKDRIVVDVGAFVGDSAIYFVMKGARKVYAIEPHPGAYQEMLENIKLNNMEDKIIPINAALGDKSGKIRIPNIDTQNTVITYYGSGNNGEIEVPMITLSQLIKDYSIEPDVLKMDCEGCEFDIILNDYEHVRLFKELIFEYHEENDRRLTDLLNKLSNDYKCNEGPVGIVHCVKLNL